MDIKDYKWLILNSNLTAFEYEGKQFVGITPKYPKHQDKLSHILATGGYTNAPYLTINEFNTLVQTMKEPLQESFKKEELLQKSTELKIQKMSPQQIAALSSAEKTDLLDNLFVSISNIHDLESTRKNKEMMERNKAHLEVLLYHLDFPKDFIKDEDAKVARYNNLLQDIPDLKNNLEQWKTIDAQTKLQIAKQMIDVFAYVYSVKDIELKTYTDKEYFDMVNEDKNATPPTGFALGEKHQIWLNSDRLDKCDNMVICNLVFHEALHIYQHEHDFSSYPNVEKLFQNKFNALQYDKNALYMLEPAEQHAYNMDRQVTSYLQNEMGVKYVASEYDKDLQNKIDTIHTKSYAAFDAKRARS